MRRLPSPRLRFVIFSLDEVAVTYLSVICEQEDWLVDSGGHKTLSDETFHNSLFELADIWTLTVEPDEYA